MFCPRCGAQLPDGATFCGSCGSPLDGTAPAAARRRSAQPDAALRTLALVAMGGVGAFGLVSFFLGLAGAVRAISLLDTLPACLAALAHAAVSLGLSLGPLMLCTRGLLLPGVGAGRGRCALAVTSAAAAIAVWALGSFVFVEPGSSTTSAQAVLCAALHPVGSWAGVSAIVLTVASGLLIYGSTRGRARASA